MKDINVFLTQKRYFTVMKICNILNRLDIVIDCLELSNVFAPFTAK